MTARRVRPPMTLAAFLVVASAAGCGIDWTVPEEPGLGGSGGSGGSGASSSAGGGGLGGGLGGDVTCPDGDATCCPDGDPTCQDCADGNANGCVVPCDEDPNQPECATCDVFADPADCNQCADCAFQGPCVQDYGACMLDPECASFIACVMDCSNDQSCAPQCASNYPNGQAGAQALTACVNDVCPASCQGQSFGL